MATLRSNPARPILLMMVWLRMTVYLNGLQIATYRSKAMARRTDDSRAQIEWTQNICARHPSKEISPAWNHKMASILGTVVELRARSVSERRQRKRYMGACSALSMEMTRMRAAFPASATRYMTQKGTEIQMWAHSSPGIPVRKRVAGRLSSLILEADILPGK